MKFSSAAVTAFLAANCSTMAVEHKHGMRQGINQAAGLFEPHATIGGKKDGDTTAKKGKKKDKEPTCSCTCEVAPCNMETTTESSTTTESTTTTPTTTMTTPTTTTTSSSTSETTTTASTTSTSTSTSPTLLSAFLRTSTTTETSTCFDVKSRQDLAFVITQAIAQGLPIIELCPVEIDMSTGNVGGIEIPDGSDITIRCAKQSHEGQCILKGPGAEATNPSRFFFIRRGGKLEVVGVNFVDGKAPGDIKRDGKRLARGGAVRNQGMFTARACSFRGNFADDEGGAVKNEEGAEAHFEKCLFDDNAAAFAGGAVTNGGKMTADGCDFTRNTAASFGGAVAMDGGDARFDDCLFAANTARDGGAVSSNKEIVDNGGTYVDNTARGNGPNIYVENGTLKCDVDVDGNPNNPSNPPTFCEQTAGNSDNGIGTQFGDFTGCQIDAVPCDCLKAVATQ